MRKILLSILFLPLFAHAITPVFTCGFECGIFNAHWVQVGTTSFSTSTVRSGDRSIRCNPSAGSGSVRLTVASSNKFVIRVYVRWASLPTSDAEVLGVTTGGFYPGVYFKQSDSKLYAATTAGFGSSGVSVTTGVWYKIDFSLDESNSIWAIDAKVDGTALGQPFLNAGANTATIVHLGADFTNETSDTFYDDFILSNTSADYPITGGQTFHFVPTSDGSHNVAGTNDFELTAGGTDILNATTNSYLQINEVPLDNSVDLINVTAPPNATDYVEHIFGPAPGISTPTAAPRVATVVAVTSETSSGVNNLRIGLNDNGTVNDVFNGDPSGAGVIEYVGKSYATAPTGGAWTVVSGAGNFNNIRSRIYSSDAAPDLQVYSIMIEAEFEEVSNTVPGTPGDKRHTTLGVGMIDLKPNQYKK